MRGQAQSRFNDVSGGILTICAGVAFLVLNDAIAKVLTDRYDPIQIIFLRNLIALPMIAVLAFALRGPMALRTPHLRLHAWRGILMMLGAYFYFTSLSFLPLAEATALIFAAPIFITAPLPWAFSICASAASSALVRSAVAAAMMFPLNS